MEKVKLLITIYIYSNLPKDEGLGTKSLRANMKTMASHAAK